MSTITTFQRNLIQHSRLLPTHVKVSDLTATPSLSPGTRDHVIRPHKGEGVISGLRKNQTPGTKKKAV